LSPSSLRTEAIEASPLPQPAPDAVRPWTGLEAVTGGGFGVMVLPSTGVRALVVQGTAVPLPPELGGRAGAPDPQGWIGPGTWGRTLGDGGREQGLLLDALPALVVQWSHPDPDAPDGTHHSTFLVVPEALSRERANRIAPALAAHAFRRFGRGHEEAGLDVRGSAMGDVDPGAAPSPPALHPWPSALRMALATLDEAPLSDPLDPGASPGSALLVGGIRDDRIHLADADASVDIALGALVAGRFALARRVLDVALVSPSAGAGSLLMAARWAAWTGEVERLRPHAETLDRLVAELVQAQQGPGGSADLPASFPSAPALIDALADAVEPLGDRGWTASLRDAARTLGGPGGQAAGPAGAAGEASPRGVRLPVIGAAAGRADPPVGPRPREAALPPVGAFASPDHPAVRGHRTVHAARFLRSVVEGLLGVRPDAAWGRITLAPDLLRLAPDADGARELRVRGLRMADARLDLDCRVQGGLGTLRLSQVSGRVPVNVVFEPRLPMVEVAGVRFGDDPADVDIEKVEGGVRLRFQFPLDPERRVSVDGTA
jgi:hypothetical protein